MFTRNLTLKLKPNCAAEFARLNENEIIPLLLKHQGFRDEIIFVAPERSEAIAISFWETRENADAYDNTGYPEVLKTLEKVIEGTPTVEDFVVSNSTLHKTAAKTA